MTRRQLERLFYRAGSRINDYNAIEKAIRTGSVKPVVGRLERRALWRWLGPLINRVGR